MDHVTIPPYAYHAAQAMKHRLDSLAKLPGSLGALEDILIRLAGITAKERPTFTRKNVVLFAADHDITQKGVSATGQEVTELQVGNFLRGGGAINAFCRSTQAELSVVDVGLKSDLPHAQGLVRRKVVRGARDFSEEPAMTRQQAVAAVQVGIDMAREKGANGAELLAAGAMGVGNTSSAAAITAVLTGAPVEKTTGVGTLGSTQRLRHKIALIQQGIARNSPDPTDALDVLSKVGGVEIGAMAGFMLGAASQRIPVVLDGFISGAAACIAIALKPEVRLMLLGSHISSEPGHLIQMQHHAIPTYFDLGMRVGEGTGAVLLFPLIDTAVRLVSEMATLKELGIELS